MIWLVTTIQLAAAAVAVAILVLAVLLALRLGSRAGRSQAPPGPSGPRSPTAIVCPFCKRDYDPPETGGRCPGCGAAAPRGR